jgi:stage IV sporulation protein FB
MRLFSIGGAEIRVSPWLLAVLPAAALCARPRLLIVAFVSLSVHEAAHAILASRLNAEVYSVEIQPFGFVARLDLRGVSLSELAAVYAAGPVASLSMAAFSALLERFVPLYAEARLGMTEYNLLIAAVNLLPAMPLDGGRLLCAALGKRHIRLAYALPKALGVMTGAGFLIISVLMLKRGFINITFPVMGVFLIFAALAEKPEAVSLRRTRRRLSLMSALPVSELAIEGGTPVYRALRLLPKGGYAVVSVIDGDLKRKAVLDESQLAEAAQRLGAAANLSDAVALFGEGML